MTQAGRHAAAPRTGTLSHRRTWRVSALAALAALLSAPLVTLLPAPAEAAITDQFVQKYSANTNGDILVAANTLETCSDGCSTTAAGAQNNNDHVSKYVDVDGDSGTFNSSSATLTIPAGGSVLYAALVWGGRVATSPGTATLGSVRLTGPDGRHDLTGGTVQSNAPTTPLAYSGFLDVTDIVRAAGTGDYTVANVQSDAGGAGKNQYAGWALVVAVADPSAPMRNLTIFRGFGEVATSGAGASANIDVSGFLTPPSGPIRTTLGAVTFEGDAGLTGDTMSLNGTALVDAANTSNNPFNSTISNRGSHVTTKSPDYENQLGFDADLLVADGILGHSATSARIALTTTQDQYFPAVVTFATELYDPKLLGEKTVQNLTQAGLPGKTLGARAAAGDRLRYTVPVENIGLDAASSSVFFDAVPTGTQYVPNSITVDGVSRTDAANDDVATFVQEAGDGEGHITVNLGAGADATRGGTIPVSTGSTQHTVTFDVIVRSTVTNDQEIVNAANLTYRGLTTAATSSSATNAATGAVTATPLTGAGAQPPTAAPHIVTFTPTPSQRDVEIDVLAGATDPDVGDVLRVVGVTDAAGGALTIDPYGHVTYAPREDFAGRDVFTYTIEDSAGNRSTALVQVDVANTAPVAADDTLTIPASTSSDVAVLANDTDANGDALAVRSVSATSAHGGTVTLVGGVVHYTAPAGYRGTDTFTYVVEDSRGASDDATVTVTLTNAAPVGVADAYETVTGRTLTTTAPGVLANDTDVNGDSLTAVLVTGPTHGTLTLNANGSFTYTPTAGYNGTDAFVYRASDGTTTSGTTTVTLTVHGLPLAVDDTATTPGGTAVDVDVTTNDTHPESATLQVTAVTAPSHGTSGRNGDGTVRYTPAAGWAGTDSFGYTVEDPYGSTSSATVTVTTGNVVPVAVADTAGTPSGTAVVVDVLSNDTDVNVAAGVPGQALAVQGTPTADHGATVTVEPDGRLRVVPAAGYAGDVTVHYVVTDGAGGTATGTLVVTVDNAAPVVPPTTATTPYGQTVALDLLADATDDNPGDDLTIVPGSLTTPRDSHGTPRGTVSLVGGVALYTPPAGFSGAVTFTYAVTDGVATTTATATVTIGNGTPPVRPQQVAAGGSGTTTIDVLAGQQDPDGGTLTIVAVTQPAHGSVAIVGGKLVYTPEPGYRGDVTFTYTVSDGQGGTTTSPVTLEVGYEVLATTGADGTLPLAAGAGALLVLGLALVLVVRRRRA